MTEHRTSAPPRMIHAGLTKWETRTRKECLRIAADAGGQPGQIISRAQAMFRHMKAAPAEDVRSNRWTCLLLATQMENPPADADGIIRAAIAFETFLSGTDGHSPA